MALIQDQQSILDEMAVIVFNSTDKKYDLCYCEYRNDPEYNTIEMHFGYEIGGVKYNSDPNSLAVWKNYELAERLKNLIKNHTGREWTSFTLTLDAEGKAHTKFHYPETQD